MNRILRLKDVTKLVSLSRSAILERVKNGKFPKPFSLGGQRAKGWTSEQIETWIEEQANQSKDD